MSALGTYQNPHPNRVQHLK